jgi:CRP-like cAMP-binding protein
MPMMASPHNPNQNHLLAALPAAEFERLLPHLELVPMRLGELLCESGDPQKQAYFPTTSIVSLHYLTRNGESAEVAGIGNEGMLGIALFMGGDTTPSRAVVQTAGHGYQLSSRLLVEEFNRFGLLLRLLLRYTQALIAQIAQTAVCNRHHSLLEQLCCWLLLTLDRMPSNELIMTQDLIAGMLGVRRPGVTEASRKLEQLGAISCRRGHITVLDRPLLHVHVCECYGVVKREFERLLCEGKRKP